MVMLFAVLSTVAGNITPSAAQSVGYGYNGYTYQLYHGNDDSAAIYAYTPSLTYYTSVVYGPYTGYTPVALTSDYYGNSYVLWRTTYGSAVIWYLNGNGD